MNFKLNNISCGCPRIKLLASKPKPLAHNLNPVCQLFPSSQYLRQLTWSLFSVV